MQQKNLMVWKDCIDLTFNQLNSEGTFPHEREFKKWALDKDREKVGWLVDTITYGKMFLVWFNRLRKKNDYVIVIVGREGFGKTTLETQLCAIIDPHFTLNRLCFTGEEVLNSFKNGNPLDAIGIDEGAFSLFSREAMVQTQRDMIKLIMAIRKKCFFIVICCPSYKDLDSYIRNHRVAMLFDIRERGKFQAYIGDALAYVNQFIQQKKRISEIKVDMKHSWYGSFRVNKPPTIDDDEYEKKKDTHIEGFIDKLQKNLKEEDSFDMLPITQVATKLRITTKTLRRYINKGTLNGKQIGNRWYITKSDYNKLISGKIPSD